MRTGMMRSRPRVIGVRTTYAVSRTGGARRSPKRASSRSGELCPVPYPPQQPSDIASEAIDDFSKASAWRCLVFEHRRQRHKPQQGM